MSRFLNVACLDVLFCVVGFVMIWICNDLGDGVKLVE